MKSDHVFKYLLDFINLNVCLSSIIKRLLELNKIELLNYLIMKKNIFFVFTDDEQKLVYYNHEICPKAAIMVYRNSILLGDKIKLESLLEYKLKTLIHESEKSLFMKIIDFFLA